MLVFPSKNLYSQLFAENSIEYCGVSSCAVTATQVGVVPTPEITYDSVTSALTAKMDEMAGYSKQLKMTCTANSGVTFEKEFSITQNALDCSNLLVPKTLDFTLSPFTFDYKNSGTQILGGPVLLQTGKHCVESGSKRISMNPTHTVASCNDLCNADNTCMQFALGMAGSETDRCDLYRADDCTFTT